MPELNIEPAAGAKLLATLVLHDALFAFDASRVQEVIRLGSVTPVEHAPQEVSGVINLRGRIVTLLDLGQILGFGKAEPGRDSRIFIVEDRGEFLGLLVDRAAEVIEVDPADQQPVPANISPAQSQFFSGVHRVGGRVIALLDLAAILPVAK